MNPTAASALIDALDSTVLRSFPALEAFAQKLGGTSLIEVPIRRGSARILAKCEFENPSGSVKDRVAFAMIYRFLSSALDEEASRAHLLEYTGGTMGVSLAVLARSLGLPLTLTLSESAPSSIQQRLRDEGAELVLVDRELGFYGVMEQAKELSRRHPDWTFLYQHVNPANPWIHRVTTGAEIIAQTAGESDLQAWVASIGTGGSLIGVGDALRSRFPDLRLYATTPEELPYGSPLPPNGLPKFAGSGGLGHGLKQSFVEPEENHIARHFTFSYEETLAEMREFHHETGLRVGSSAAANLLAAREVASELGTGAVVATVFPSLASPEEWSRSQKLGDNR